MLKSQDINCDTCEHSDRNDNDLPCAWCVEALEPVCWHKKPWYKRISFFFAWYDMWLGLYWDREKRYLYIMPLPMIGIKLQIF